MHWQVGFMVGFSNGSIGQLRRRHAIFFPKWFYCTTGNGMASVFPDISNRSRLYPKT
tara:strand:- start:153 stop:323 length:171 start_codon:yes stop_codon:yes gene_type:complete